MVEQDFPQARSRLGPLDGNSVVSTVQYGKGPRGSRPSVGKPRPWSSCLSFLKETSIDGISTHARGLLAPTATHVCTDPGRSAIPLLVLTSRRGIMKEDTSGWVLRWAGALGAALLVALDVYLLVGFLLAPFT